MRTIDWNKYFDENTKPIEERISGRKHTCTMCGNEDIWGKTWKSYGSVIIEEERPEDLIKCCSEKCINECALKIKTGEIKLPVISSSATHCDIISEREGY